MGYKYGVWLVYKTRKIPTKHVGHFTIACYMEKEEALNLYQELINKFGKYHDMCIECTKPIYFDQNMYKDDDNNIYSWGYNGQLVQNEQDQNTSWAEIEEITKNYKCNISHHIHTSMDYSTDKQLLHTLEMLNNKVVACSIELVDITSDNPLDWSIISGDIERLMT